VFAFIEALMNAFVNAVGWSGDIRFAPITNLLSGEHLACEDHLAVNTRGGSRAHVELDVGTDTLHMTILAVAGSIERMDLTDDWRVDFINAPQEHRPVSSEWAFQAKVNLGGDANELFATMLEGLRQQLRRLRFLPTTEIKPLESNETT
jgi:hypothetical protein